ncbi:MAG: uroporphyrinogen decarboxylase [Rhodomicrobium sp.]|nr:uroporphyrinogen decarboxylase [Rhodomicrobium sp.]
MEDTLQNAPSLPKFVQVLKGEAMAAPPVWLMRQAGRYLPEYRELRAKADGFLDLCYRPDWAAEITLQPIRRFDFDAAILFSDILVVPDALGQKVSFEEGVGPRLDGMEPQALLKHLKPEAAAPTFARICETVERVRVGLSPDKALIGFCGAPWTVATYMIAGQGTPDQAPARLAAYRDPEGFTALLDLLAEVSVEYLSGQIAAGAQAVQIFDSWAGVLPDGEFARWVIAPTARMVKSLKARHPDVPVIGFPRGADTLSERFVKETGVDAIGCDTAMPLAQMRALGKHAAVQGNLDPLLLVAGGPLLQSRIRDIIGALQGVPHIFNLGHGILQTTPIGHVETLMATVRG